MRARSVIMPSIERPSASRSQRTSSSSPMSSHSRDEALEEVDPLATSALPQVGARDDAMAIMEELEELDEVGELGALEELRESAEFDALSLMGGLESLSELSDSADLDESLEPFDPGDAWADEVSFEAAPPALTPPVQATAPAAPPEQTPRLKLGPLSSWLPAPTVISPRSATSPSVTPGVRLAMPSLSRYR